MRPLAAQLLNMASECGLDQLTQIDFQEAGPTRRSAEAAAFDRAMQRRVERIKMASRAGGSPSTKLLFQLVAISLAILALNGSLNKVLVWDWIVAARLPSCPEPEWWHAALPSSWQHGANGECVANANQG